MPITRTNPFKGRQFPGQVIMLCVRWYLRHPLAYEHVAELLAERGVDVDLQLHLAVGAGLRPISAKIRRLTIRPLATEHELPADDAIEIASFGRGAQKGCMYIGRHVPVSIDSPIAKLDLKKFTVGINRRLSPD